MELYYKKQQQQQQQQKNTTLNTGFLGQRQREIKEISRMRFQKILRSFNTEASTILRS